MVITINPKANGSRKKVFPYSLMDKNRFFSTINPSTNPMIKAGWEYSNFFIANPSNPNTSATIISNQELRTTKAPVKITVSSDGTNSVARRKVTRANGLATAIPMSVPMKLPSTTVQIIKKARSK